MDLASERLGITAKLDLLEGDGESGVIPVDKKDGTQTDTEWRGIPS
ncbi:MAG: hypothetical protein ACRDN0_22415 [Trebonia sp.]